MSIGPPQCRGCWKSGASAVSRTREIVAWDASPDALTTSWNRFVALAYMNPWNEQLIGELDVPPLAGFTASSGFVVGLPGGHHVGTVTQSLLAAVRKSGGYGRCFG